MICGGLAFTQVNPQNPEYNLKAAFLYRFMEYIEWDGQEQSGDLQIVVLGDSEIVRPLIEITRDKRINNRRVRVRQFYTPSDINKTDIIFVSKRYKFSVEAVMARVAEQQTLVISESTESFEQGTHINFMIHDNKLKFAVNLRNASRSGIRISSQLLQHAVIIKR